MAATHKDVAVSIGAVANVSKLNLFNPQFVTGIGGIRVFDVGQGDCIGLLDQSNNVFCYVDYGGLNDHPDANAINPAATASRLPVNLYGSFVSIVLTHWDKDHYYSAVKKNPAAQACEWLVPRQIVSPQAVLFAAKLNKAKAKCWPEPRGNQAVRIGVGNGYDVEIRKCKAFVPNAIKEDRNISGLAITLLRWTGAKVDSLIVLPGDCHFDSIPNVPPGVPIRALVAYHHGSHVNWTNQTKQSISNMTATHAMAYSFGKNTFGHPQRMNYQPGWDPHATCTKDVRANGLEFQDFYW